MAAPCEHGRGPADGAVVSGQEPQESPGPEPAFVYTDRDLFRSGIRWDGPRPPSRLDAALRSAWARRMEAGCFRYRLWGPELPSRELPGPRRLLAQLNVRRATERRRPQEILSVRQPFDPQRFNFSRVPRRELLFPLRRSGGPEAGAWSGGEAEGWSGGEAGTWSGGEPEARSWGEPEDGSGGEAKARSGGGAGVRSGGGAGVRSGGEAKAQSWGEPEDGSGGEARARSGGEPEDRSGGEAEALLIINVSPLQYGHVLLLPEPEQLLPQALTRASVLWALDMVFLSSEPAFRVGFNSLGAFASVNHLHLHGFYLQHRLEVEWAPTQPLGQAGVAARVHRLCDHFTQGLVLYSDGSDRAEVADTLLAVSDLLLHRSLAHNLLVTRGCRLGPRPPDLDSRDGVRLILWPRTSCFGVKDGSAFNVAVCELAGFLPIKTARDFEILTEKSALQIIGQHLLPPEQFSQLSAEIARLPLN